MEEIDLESIRNTLGLSQQNLADFLGVHRSAVSKTELGTRTLPDVALIKAIALDHLIESFPEESKPDFLLQMEQDIRTNLKDSFAKKLRQARNAREKLLLQKEDVDEKNRQIILRCYVLGELENEPILDKNWKDWLEADTEVLIEKWGLETTEAIDYQIAFLDFQIGYYESKLPVPVQP